MNKQIDASKSPSTESSNITSSQVEVEKIRGEEILRDKTRAKFQIVFCKFKNNEEFNEFDSWSC